ncbi:MAG: amidinotransferase [Reichenbachiella sp.]
MFEINVNDETATLSSVILGTAQSLGGTPTLEQAYDARSKESIRLGIYPEEKDLIKEMESFHDILKKYGVQVFRPDLLNDTNQVYTRDIGFVIGNKFVIPNIISDREHEKDGIASFIENISQDQLIRMPVGARAEGGDVMVWKGKLFVGYSEQADFDEYYVSRTNLAGLQFLEKAFPEMEVRGFELVKSDEEPRNSALHLDCCFQPIGNNQCIICQKGFKNNTDFEFLIQHFGVENCIILSEEEMYEMNSNVFSISPNVIVVGENFSKLNLELEQRGFKVEKIRYNEVRKMGGLFRCSTLPLLRR